MDDILELLYRRKAVMKGHFLLTSGLHSDTYIQCAQVCQYPEDNQLLAERIAKLFSDENIDLVVGPAVGGIIIAYETAKVLGARNIFAERESGILTFRRGFSIERGEKVLVVEDVITTAGTVKELKDLVISYGGDVTGISSIVNRGNIRDIDGIPVRSLVYLPLSTYSPEECPLCRNNIPVVKPGSRRRNEQDTFRNSE
ncbi:MAG TPA: orotate phosphoribosyltransferase [bacterium]|nr:orotate phosphoribosyltransferase [bacterium]